MWKSIVFSHCLVLIAASIGFGDPDVGPNEPRSMADDAPVPVDNEKKIKHLGAALEHLQAAGMDELATKVSEQLRQVQRALHQGELTRKLVELHTLQKEIDRLRRLAGSPAKTLVRVRMIEIDRRKLPIPDQKKESSSVAPFDDIRDLKMLNARVKELVQQGVVKVLAAPELMTFSGKRCDFVSGGEFPVPIPGGVVPASGGGDNFQMKRYRVRVEALTQSLGGDRHSLEISAEFSTLDMSNSVKVHGQTVPGLNVRHIHTRVELDSGRPCILGGLTSDGPDGVKELVVILIAETASE